MKFIWGMRKEGEKRVEGEKGREQRRTERERRERKKRLAGTRGNRERESVKKEGERIGDREPGSKQSSYTPGWHLVAGDDVSCC